ncbi:MAG: hypothetical protein LBG15_09380 [Dysgonamonadaceae bacterium]|jgi:wobble nucleotide-excising tRNase|nr:hypothetical protein [Dysgonamonadaceae bacterium]
METAEEKQVQQEILSAEQLKKRRIELKRQADVAVIEAESIALDIGENKTFGLKDLQAYQRVRARLSRLKEESGAIYRTAINGNDVTVTRIA